jgi:DNA-binding SARP family transcriptional activator
LASTTLEVGARRGAPALALSLLGSFELRAGDQALGVPASSQRLVALLALRGGTAQRPHVAGTLWPDASERQAHGSLRSALWRLRGTGGDVVEADQVSLRLAPDVAVDLRIAEALARRLLDRSRPPADADLGLASVDLLSADLLPDWYDDWALLETESWRQLRLHGLEALAGHLADAGRYGEALLAAMAAVRAEPLRESGHAAVIRVHLAEGNHGEARRQFGQYRRLLDTELGLEPTPRLQELLPAS